MEHMSLFAVLFVHSDILLGVSPSFKSQFRVRPHQSYFRPVEMDKLSPTEKQAVVDFCALTFISGGHVPNCAQSKTALKFLIARKFDVARAVELHESHETVRAREGLMPHERPNPQQVDLLKRELESGKFKIFPMPPGDTGARIALFTASKHIPSATTHQTTLQAVLYQLDAALDSYDPATAIKQGGNFIFICNMIGFDNSSFDFELAYKLTNALEGAYPARLKVALIVGAQDWCVAVLRSEFLQRKLFDRVHSMSLDQLHFNVPKSILPQELGGELKFDSQSSALIDQLLDRPVDTTLVAQVDNKVNQIEETTLPLKDFVQNFDSNLLSAEYHLIVNSPPSGTFTSFNLSENAIKNRYTDIECYDHSRVKLALIDGVPHSDYIHANHVDGYKQKGAFICTQGPKCETIYDFWRMVWQEQCLVIVMTTQLIEGYRFKCELYWPAEDSEVSTINNLSITNDRVEKCPKWVISHLTLTNTDTSEKRSVVHLLFTSWPDHGVPSSPTTMLHFREQVRHYQKELLKSIQWTGHPGGPPIIVHCSAGIGRTGTFITIDISIQRLQETGRVNIKGTVEKIRSQRALAVQTYEQYRFCYWALLEFAHSNGMLPDVDVARLMQ